MESFQRSQVTTVCLRLAEDPHQLIALFGPRQTGKTTILHQVLAQIDLDSLYLAVDKPDSSPPFVRSDETEVTFPISRLRDTSWLVSSWERARREAERFGRGFVLVFDEIQKIPRWSETIKGCGTPTAPEACPCG